MKIQLLNEHLSQKWEEIGLFYPLKANYLEINETEMDKKKDNLLWIKLENIPAECWIFENEYIQMENPKLSTQKASFSTAGDKVEKMLVWVKDNFLYLFMVEMKTTLTIDNVSNCIGKFEHSLNFFVSYLASHAHFRAFSHLYIAPIGMIFYNQEGDYSNPYKFNYGKTKPRFKEKYIKANKRSFLMQIEPISLAQKEIPVLYFQNPQHTTGFEINFDEILQRINEI